LSKKIVIIPTFAESHLIEFQIPNIIDTINPDYIIYNEGLFPGGTEGKKILTKEWMDEYTLDGKRAFDYKDLEKIIDTAQKKYTDTKIILNPIDYDKSMDSTACYVKGCTNFDELGIKIEEGDYLFPYEGDVFHHENSAKEISGYMEQIEPGQGFRSIWIDYMQNFWYVEKNKIKQFLQDEKHHHEGNYMSRRICIRYDKGGEFYNYILNNFMTTSYHNPDEGYGKLFPTDLITYHYAWIRPGKFRELRCDQLQRWHGYFDIIKHSLDKTNELKYNEILFRPTQAHLTDGWLKFFDVLEHPKHIKNHVDYFEIDEDTKEKLRKPSVYCPKELLNIYQPFAVNNFLDYDTIPVGAIKKVLDTIDE
tara:strand:+ start:4763 stop:5854 length:1092 start_codon:yes stop_codon:yes gene_type:complete